MSFLGLSRKALKRLAFMTTTIAAGFSFASLANAKGIEQCDGLNYNDACTITSQDAAQTSQGTKKGRGVASRAVSQAEFDALDPYSKLSSRLYTAYILKKVGSPKEVANTKIGGFNFTYNGTASPQGTYQAIPTDRFVDVNGNGTFDNGDIIIARGKLGPLQATRVFIDCGAVLDEPKSADNANAEDQEPSDTEIVVPGNRADEQPAIVIAAAPVAAIGGGTVVAAEKKPSRFSGVARAAIDTSGKQDFNYGIVGELDANIAGPLSVNLLAGVANGSVRADVTAGLTLPLGSDGSSITARAGYSPRIVAGADFGPGMAGDVDDIVTREGVVVGADVVTEPFSGAINYRNGSGLTEFNGLGILNINRLSLTGRIVKGKADGYSNAAGVAADYNGWSLQPGVRVTGSDTLGGLSIIGLAGQRDVNIITPIEGFGRDRDQDFYGAGLRLEDRKRGFDGSILAGVASGSVVTTRPTGAPSDTPEPSVFAVRATATWTFGGNPNRADTARIDSKSRAAARRVCTQETEVGAMGPVPVTKCVTTGAASVPAAPPIVQIKPGQESVAASLATQVGMKYKELLTRTFDENGKNTSDIFNGCVAEANSPTPNAAIIAECDRAAASLADDKGLILQGDGTGYDLIDENGTKISMSRREPTTGFFAAAKPTLRERLFGDRKAAAPTLRAA